MRLSFYCCHSEQPRLSLIHTSVTRTVKLKQLFHLAARKRYALVSYRLPGAENPETIVQLSEESLHWEAGCTGGFVVAPFDFPDSPARWVRADLQCTGFSQSARELRTGNLPPHLLLALTELHQELEQPDEEQQPDLGAAGAAVDLSTYLGQVSSTLRAIQTGSLHKVVLSRVKQVPLPPHHPADLFERLCQAYPQAFVSMISIPGWGLWLGATPELLLENRGTEFRTMSLAGTRALSKEPRPWSDKEFREQQMVTDYICERMEAAGLHTSVGERETITAGQVQHLRNLILASGSADVFALAKSLHPTPAVCGLPVQAARNYLRFLEAHQRRLYGGFIGPVDAEGHHRLYVNLRSMELHHSSAGLYLGGGIVEGSVPEAEWLETEHKAATLLRILQA